MAYKEKNEKFCEHSKMSTDEAKLAALQQKYNSFQSDITELTEQVGTLSSQLQEHLIVDQTLSKIDPSKRSDRKCFKMIGGVLVEKTVDDVIKLLDDDIKLLKTQRESTEKLLNTTRKSLEDFIKTNNIKIVRQ